MVWLCGEDARFRKENTQRKNWLPCACLRMQPGVDDITIEAAEHKQQIGYIGEVSYTGKRSLFQARLDLQWSYRAT